MRVADIWWQRPARATRWTAGAVAAAALLAGGVAAKSFGEWSDPVRVDLLDGSDTDPVSGVNTTSVDGCPVLSPYDGSLYMASNRPGGHGGLDIWIAPRKGDGWGTPKNAGPGINTTADEFCPTPARGNRFFFVRRQSPTDTDIYVVKKLPNRWGEAEMLTKAPGEINSNAEEWSPSWFEAPDGREFLYFSSTRNHPPSPPPAPPPPQDIFYSVNFGQAQLAPGDVNSPSSDARPNVRRDGLEIVWDSTRPGTLGGPDIWTSSRPSVDAPWGTAEHLPAPINSAAPESRASLSWDSTKLMFGSARPGVGATDIYMSTRSKDTGKK